MRSAVVVLLFVVVAAVAGWFVFRSQGTPPMGTAAPANVATSKRDARVETPALAGPGDAQASERAAATPLAVPQKAASSAAATSTSKVGLTGRVVDAAGKGIAGARVLVAPSHEFMRWPVDAEGGFLGGGEKPLATTSNAEGRFTVADVKPGAIRLAVRASGFAPADQVDVPVPAAASHDLGDIELALGVRVAGRVVDSVGRGVAGAKLLRVAEHTGPVVFSFGRPWGVPLATSDANGYFVIDTLAAGSFRLLTTSEDHPDEVTRGATAAPGERVDGLEIALAEGLEISGRVVGLPASVSGELLVQAWPQGAEASEQSPEDQAETPPHVELRSANVAADGSFVVRGVRRGLRYQLSAIRSGGENDWWGDSLTARKQVEAGARGIELTYQPESALVFQVVDRATKRPLEDFQVSAGADWPVPLTDEKDERASPKRHHPEGKVRFGRLRTGRSQRVTLKIEAVGYESYSRDDLALGEGEEADLGVIELAPAPVLTVRVLDSVTQQPIAGARVELADEPVENGEHRFGVRLSSDGAGDEVEFGDSRSGRTDEQGVARVASIQSDRCRLRVKHDDYAPHKSELFELTAGSSSERVVQLGRGGAVHAKLVGADGKLSPGSRVEHRSNDQQPGAFAMEAGMGGGGVVTDAEGVAHFVHLAPGVHRFRAKSAGGGAGVFGNGMEMVMLGGPEEQGDPWTDVEVSEGSEAEITVVAPQVSRVHGRITESGRALAGATVRLEKKQSGNGPRMPMPFGPTGPSAETAADGSYALENIRAGEYTVVVTHAERVMPSEFEWVVSALEERFDADLPLAILEGRVLDAAQQPVANAEVWPERARASGAKPRAIMRARMVSSNGGGSVTTIGDGPEAPRARTNADGRYQLRGVTADVDLVVKCRASGYQPGESETERVAPGQTKQGVDLALAVAGGLDLTVSGGDPEGERYYVVRAKWAGEGDAPDERNEVTDENGKLKLDGLKPGPWMVSVRRMMGQPGGAKVPPTEQRFEVEDGETSPATIELP